LKEGTVFRETWCSHRAHAPLPPYTNSRTAAVSPKVGRKGIVDAAQALDTTIDVVAAHTLGHQNWSDEQQLRYATAEGRILVTEDRKDFPPIALAFIARGERFSGIVLLPSSIAHDEYARIARAIVRFEREHPDGVPHGYVDYLRPDDPR
jgi:predicted nuclease of predicted toxin-antitoxin system